MAAASLRAAKEAMLAELKKPPRIEPDRVFWYELIPWYLYWMRQGDAQQTRYYADLLDDSGMDWVGYLDRNFEGILFYASHFMPDMP